MRAEARSSGTFVPAARAGTKRRGIAVCTKAGLALAIALAGNLILPARAAPLGLPEPPQAVSAPPAPVALGRKLFMDRRLSANGTLSCAMCHVPEQGFTSNELRTAVGIEGRSLRRNTPTVLNVAYVQALFLDGRESSLEKQAWGPLLAPDEMGNPSVEHVVRKVRRLPDYAGLFAAAFGRNMVNAGTIGAALAAYQRSLVSGNSRFDRWRYGGEADALDALEQAGFQLFRGKARCTACHKVGERSALFSDGAFRNTGVSRHSRSEALATSAVRLAEGVTVNMDADALRAFDAPAPADLGRYEVTGNPSDRWVYRTPSLRNVALTAPYMHDGSLATLEEVVEYYDRGGADPDQDGRMEPLGLTQREKQALVAFLRTLTGDNVAQLVEQARGGKRRH